MPSRTENYFELIVKPTVNEFLADTANIRRGCLAAIVLNHMADYFATDTNDKKERSPQKSFVRQTRNNLCAKCPEFNFIQDIADATKHAELSTDSRIPYSSTQINRSPGLFDAPFGEGLFAEAITVFVTLQDGTCKELEPDIRSVLKMWENELYSNNHEQKK